VPLGATVLDVGSGTGVVAAALSRVVGPAGRVIGADPSAAIIRRPASLARSRNRGANAWSSVSERGF
jgi:ubiquinone/menaquinone biosynthesis C-methylase UbiE